MCMLLTPVLNILTTVINEVYLQCFAQSVSQVDLGKSLRAEISSSRCIIVKAVKVAQIGSALTERTSSRVIHPFNAN